LSRLAIGGSRLTSVSRPVMPRMVTAISGMATNDSRLNGRQSGHPAPYRRELRAARKGRQGQASALKPSLDKAREPILRDRYDRRSAGLLPGIDAALDVTRGDDARALCRLHRHGRALSEGAVEYQPLAGGAGQFVQHAAGTHVVGEIGVRRVERTGNEAVLLALAPLAQIDEGRVAAPEQLQRIAGSDGPAAARDLLVRHA